MNKRQCMTAGIPDCPDCGGKGMCSKHKFEYLEWVCKTACNEYEAAMKEYKKELETKIAENKKGN